MLSISCVVMRAGLLRIYGARHLHFITNSCYRRLPLLDSPWARDRFLAIVEQTRVKYRFVVVGYVVMPEHVHLLLSEPELGSPSLVMQVLKQRTAHALLPKRRRRDARQRDLLIEPSQRVFWQARFYDFNVWSEKKRIEKLRYMHNNPMKRALVDSPEHWPWSSYRHYFLGEADTRRGSKRFRKLCRSKENGQRNSCPGLLLRSMVPVRNELTWGAYICSKRRWRKGYAWLAAAAVWLIAVCIDFAHH